MTTSRDSDDAATRTSCGPESFAGDLGKTRTRELGPSHGLGDAGKNYESLWVVVTGRYANRSGCSIISDGKREHIHTHTLARAIVADTERYREEHTYVRTGVNVPTVGRRISRRCTSSGAPPLHDGWAVANGKAAGGGTAAAAAVSWAERRRAFVGRQPRTPSVGEDNCLPIFEDVRDLCNFHRHTMYTEF